MHKNKMHKHLSENVIVSGKTLNISSARDYNVCWGGTPSSPVMMMIIMMTISGRIGAVLAQIQISNV
jgi:hypothetical protein